MADPVQPLVPMAPEDLQKQFTALELHNFADGGDAPKRILTDILKENPALLEHTFIGRYGEKTNLLIELIRADKASLALMVLQDFKASLPEAMIKGYNPEPAKPDEKATKPDEKKAKPDEKSGKPEEKPAKPPMLNPLALALRKSPDVALELMVQGAGIENISPDGDNILHVLMARSNPSTIGKVLEHLDRKLTEEQRKALFSQQNTDKKTPLELMTYPPNLVPFLERQYITQSEMKKLADNWLSDKEKKLQAKGAYDQEFDKLLSEVLSMHEALCSAKMKRNISSAIGEKIVSLGRGDDVHAGFYVQKLNMLCEHASDKTKDTWFAQAVPYQPAFQFRTQAPLWLLAKGAKPNCQDVINATIYAEEIDIVQGALNACKNNPDFLNTPCTFMGSPYNNCLHFGIVCGFAAEQKRLPIVALLIERGAKVTEQTYDIPLGQKMAAGVAVDVIKDCRKNNLPYPAGAMKVLETAWTEADKTQKPNAGMLKDRAEIREMFKKWEDDDKMKKLLKNNTGFAPGIIPASNLAETDPDTNALSAAFPGMPRRMVKS